jgi:hypothetical protein
MTFNFHLYVLHKTPSLDLNGAQINISGSGVNKNISRGNNRCSTQKQERAKKFPQYAEAPLHAEAKWTLSHFPLFLPVNLIIRYQ